MIKWEYLLTYFDTDDFDGMQEMLDANGKNGWELVSFMPAIPEDMIIFKRQKIFEIPVFLNKPDDIAIDK